MNEITVVLLLAFLCEALTEYFVGEPLSHYEDGKYCWLLKYVGAGVGVVFCVIYKIDILLAFLNLQPAVVGVGWVVSGIIIGRGSNFLNDVMDRIRVLLPVVPTMNTIYNVTDSTEVPPSRAPVPTPIVRGS